MSVRHFTILFNEWMDGWKRYCINVPVRVQYTWNIFIDQNRCVLSAIPFVFFVNPLLRSQGFTKDTTGIAQRLQRFNTLPILDMS